MLLNVFYQVDLHKIVPTILTLYDLSLDIPKLGCVVLVCGMGVVEGHAKCFKMFTNIHLIKKIIM